MKVLVFDLLAYGEQLEHLKVGNELPYPLPKTYREYQVHNVALAQSRARFEEAFDIITRAWTEEVFSYRGEFWSYKDVAMWPRPVQQPHPPI